MIIGLIFLIVPGIIIGIRLIFTWFLIIDKKSSAMVAIKDSWRMTKGYSWTIFGMALLAIPIVLIGFILLLV